MLWYFISTEVRRNFQQQRYPALMLLLQTGPFLHQCLQQFLQFLAKLQTAQAGLFLLRFPHLSGPRSGFSRPQH